MTSMYCDKAGDYDVPHVLSQKDLVFRPDLSNINRTIIVLPNIFYSFQNHRDCILIAL